MTGRNEKGQFLKGSQIKDLKGQRFGRLVVLELSEKKSGRKTYWLCRCDCGTIKTIRSDTLTSKREPRTVSCGCQRDEQAAKNVIKNHKHKGSRTRLYTIWQNMKSRCLNPKDDRYYRYGNRGIKVCDEWINDFANFEQWAMNSGYTEKLTIERTDIDKGYEPSNCSWIPYIDQANNRRPTIWIEHQGEKLNLKQWSDKLGISYGTLNSRYHRGKREPKELFAPVIKR